MQIIIYAPLTYSETYEPCIRTEDIFDNQEEVAELHKLLDSFSVHHSVTNHMSGMSLTIYEQKCTLDEVNTNTLFHAVIDRFFDYNLTYLSLGGVGCEFSIGITPSTTTNPHQF